MPRKTRTSAKSLASVAAYVTETHKPTLSAAAAPGALSHFALRTVRLALYEPQLTTLENWTSVPFLALAVCLRKQKLPGQQMRQWSLPS